MKFVSSEYDLIKCMQMINERYPSMGQISHQDLKKFCISVMKTKNTKAWFAAMYDACYDQTSLEQKQFYQFSRRIDTKIVSNTESEILFKKYDDMMNFLLEGDGDDYNADPTVIRYHKLISNYNSKNNPFRFKSILIPEKKKVCQIYKFDPTNLM